MTNQKKKFGRSRIFSNMSPFEGLLLGFVTMGVSENSPKSCRLETKTNVDLDHG